MIIDIFTYSQASSNASYGIEALIEGAKAARLDGICVTDRAFSKHAYDLVRVGAEARLFVGVGIEFETTVGRIVAYPRTIDDAFVNEDWRSVGEPITAEAVLDYFHERGGIVIARDVYNRGEGIKDNVFHIKDSQGRGFDGVDTVAAYRRRIDNELSIEAQQVAKVPACAGSGVFDDINDIGICATMFADKITNQAEFVEAMKARSHWACSLRDLGEACPMGSAPKVEEEREDRRGGDRGERSFRRGGDRDHRGGDRDRRGGDRRRGDRDHRGGDHDRRGGNHRGGDRNHRGGNRRPRD